MATIRFGDSDLAGEFERPPGWFWDKMATPVRGEIVRSDADVGVVAVRVQGPHGRRGVGIWEVGSGRLIWSHDWADNVRMLTSGTVLAVAEGLCLYCWPEMTVLKQTDAHRYAAELVLSPSERFVATWLNDGQGANGYEVFDLDRGLRRLTTTGMTLDPMYSMPVFSPAERLLACAPGCGAGWWTDCDEPDDLPQEYGIEAFGGVRTFASLLVHDLESDAVSRHLLQFDLEPGWTPEDVWDERWDYGAVGLAFPAEDRIQVVLPDNATADLLLPLPETVLLPAPDSRLPARPS